MTDRTIAITALVVALAALVGLVLHALARDASHGGIAHERGFTSSGSFKWSNIGDGATGALPGANQAPQLAEPPRVVGAPGIVPLPSDLGVAL